MSDIIDAMYLSQFRDPRTGEIDMQEVEEFEEQEWGWITLTERVTDGRMSWFETQRYLYYSPEEAQALFLEHIKNKGWTIEEDM